MGLKAVLDTLDGVDESLKGFYQQADGKFRLDIEGGYKLPSEVEGLTSALGKERQRARPKSFTASGLRHCRQQSKMTLWVVCGLNYYAMARYNGDN